MKPNTRIEPGRDPLGRQRCCLSALRPREPQTPLKIEEAAFQRRFAKSMSNFTTLDTLTRKP
jgi:hypothetical protein